MNAIWNLTIEDYVAIIELAKLNGKKEGDSIEEELFAYMEEKGQKPCGMTELTKEEYIRECTSKNLNVLDMSTMEIKKGKDSDKTI